MSQLQFLENRSNGTGQLALRNISCSEKSTRAIASQIRRVSPFSVSPRIYFSVRNDTATFSARISHRGIARRRDTARPSDETFRASSLLRRAFSTSRPLRPSCLPPTRFLLRHFPCPPRRSGVKFRRPFSDPRRFREISWRHARFILPVIVGRGRAHLRKNFVETSVEKVLIRTRPS